MKRMLINATQPEELRVALVDGQNLYDFDIEQIGEERKRSNIYKGKVIRIEKSLGAAFVDFGSEKNGFLPFKELSPQFLKGKNQNTSINDCLSQGQEILIQIDKEERGTKGAALSTFISLPGHYLVLMPNNPEGGGISRSIEGESRDEMRLKMKSLEVPNGMSVILRTAGEGKNIDELIWDLEYLLSLWDAIQEAYQQKKIPFLIYKEDDLISRSLRDFLREDITEVLIDTDEAHNKALEFTEKVMPDFEDRIKRYDESIPLFTRYQIETQIETAYQREVKLINGGSIVIDQTEALVSIDINSSKATSGTDIEETALKTNIEAAKEIAKQLRLRDMGGLIVIDFIDMQTLKNKRIVEEMLLKSLSIDRAKVQVGRISRFGLLEMSRQRLRPSIQERWTQDIGSLSTAVLRLIEEEGGKKKSGEVRAFVSTNMSTFILNERRQRINEIEQKTGTRIVVVSDSSRSDDRFEVSRIRGDDAKLNETASYTIQQEMLSSNDSVVSPQKINQQDPAVNIRPSRRPLKKESFFQKLLKPFVNSEDEKNKRRKPKKDLKRKHKQPKGQNKRKADSARPRLREKKSKVDKKPNNHRKSSKTHPIKKGNIKSTKVSEEKIKGKDIRSTKLSEEKKQNKNEENKMDKDNLSVKTKPVHKDTVNNKVKEQEKKKQVLKSAKQWGQASNDPRRKN